MPRRAGAVDAVSFRCGDFYSDKLGFLRRDSLDQPILISELACTAFLIWGKRAEALRHPVPKIDG